MKTKTEIPGDGTMIGLIRQIKKKNKEIFVYVAEGDKCDEDKVKDVAGRLLKLIKEWEKLN